MHHFDTNNKVIRREHFQKNHKMGIIVMLKSQLGWFIKTKDEAKFKKKIPIPPYLAVLFFFFQHMYIYNIRSHIWIKACVQVQHTSYMKRHTIQHKNIHYFSQGLISTKNLITVGYLKTNQSTEIKMAYLMPKFDTHFLRNSSSNAHSSNPSWLCTSNLYRKAKIMI